MDSNPVGAQQAKRNEPREAKAGFCGSYRRSGFARKEGVVRPGTRTTEHETDAPRRPKACGVT